MPNNQNQNRGGGGNRNQGRNQGRNRGNQGGGQIGITLMPPQTTPVIEKSTDKAGKFNVQFRVLFSKTPQNPMRLVVSIQGRRLHVENLSQDGPIVISNVSLDTNRDVDIKVEVVGGKSDTLTIPVQDIASSKPASSSKSKDRFTIGASFDRGSNLNTISISTFGEDGKPEKGEVVMTISQSCTVFFPRGNSKSYTETQQPRIPTKDIGTTVVQMRLTRAHVTAVCTHEESGQVKRVSLLFQAATGVQAPTP